MYELGYDSDGELPYFGNMEEEKMLMELFNEVSVGSETTSPPQEEESTSTSNGTTTTTNQNSPSFILITDEEINRLKVDLLRRELKKRGLSVGGKKLGSNFSSKKQWNKESALWLSPQTSQLPTYKIFLLELTGKLSNHQEKLTIQQVEVFTAPLKIQ